MFCFPFCQVYVMICLRVPIAVNVLWIFPGVSGAPGNIQGNLAAHHIHQYYSSVPTNMSKYTTWLMYGKP